MNMYELLGQIYRLLGEINQGLLSEAEVCEIPPEIRAVIRALAEARRALDRTSKREVLNSPPSPALKSTHEEDRGAAIAVPFDGDLSLASLIDSTKGITNEQITRLLVRSGLEIRHRPKQSRKELLRHASTLLKRLP